MFQYSFCVFQCAITVIHLPTLQVGAMIQRHVGVSIGGTAGISAEAAGIDGIAIQRHNQHRRRLTKGNIPVTVILRK
jgi:hypothetical protein